jgi:hypothetical protein
MAAVYRWQTGKRKEEMLEKTSWGEGVVDL